MAYLDTYSTKAAPVNADSVIGVDSENSNTVVRYLFSDLATFFGGGGSGETARKYRQIVNAGTSSTNFASMPLASTEWNKRLRRFDNFVGYTTCRLTTYVVGAGSAGSKFTLEYTTDLTGASGWTALCEVAIDASSNDAPIAGTAVTIPAPAKAEVMLRIMGSGGNGSSSPSVSNLVLEVIP